MWRLVEAGFSHAFQLYSYTMCHTTPVLLSRIFGIAALLRNINVPEDYDFSSQRLGKDQFRHFKEVRRFSACMFLGGNYIVLDMEIRDGLIASRPPLVNHCTNFF
jgi:hypothetical protein